MLLYGEYIPSPTAVRRSDKAVARYSSQIFAFASVDRLLQVQRLIKGYATGVMNHISYSKAIRAPLVPLCKGVDSDGIPEGDFMVTVAKEGIRDEYDGSIIKVELVHAIADEGIPQASIYL